jgi:tetratricopeptide (TPR) repeat protein
MIHEVHRRSLWQVLSVYLVASWVALQVVESISESAGLPDWARPFALVLLVIGLPVVLATAVVQEGMTTGRSSEGRDGSSAVPESGGRESGHQTAGPAGPHASRGVESGASLGPAPTASRRGPWGVHRLFTWRNAIAGGVAAFALLGMLVTGYFVMWSSGIGPVGSLAAQGVFNEGDAVVLAEFENTSNDPSLGEMVTEALRVDLAGSSVITLVEPDRVRDALRRMGQTSDERLGPELAREVAIRDGFKAVIHGSVGSAGSGFLFVASMQAAESGTTLATFREAARSPDDVIDAIDKLSQDIREKAGESLKVIKAEEPLEKVSTSSLEALRKYVEAERLGDQAQYARAIATMEEALALDPDFAMAYRKLAVLQASGGGTLSSQVQAATRAYELRDRLTERERHLAEAYYHNTVTGNVTAEIQAYEMVLERFPDDQAALNNIALALLARTRLEEAIQYLERAVNGPGASAPAYTNLPGYLAMAGRHQEAVEALADMKARYPGRGVWESWNRFTLAAFKLDGEEAHAAGQELLARPEAQGGWESAGSMAMSVGDALQGSIREAHQHSAEDIAAMRELGLWDLVTYAEVGAVHLELVLGRDQEAREVYSRLDLDETLAAASPSERKYEEAVLIRALLGSEQEVDRTLETWKNDGIPSSSGTVFEEVQRVAEALLVGHSDPGQGLEGLNDLSRSMNCPGCYVWERASLAQEAGRLEEARDLFLATTRLSSSDYFLDPVRRLLAHERLAGLYEELGDPVEAANHYATFADAWSEADADLQPRVQAARDRVAALRGN